MISSKIFIPQSIKDIPEFNNNNSQDQQYQFRHPEYKLHQMDQIEKKYDQDINFEPNVNLNNSDSRCLSFLDMNSWDRISEAQQKTNITWKKKGLTILYYVSKFIKQMKTHNANLRLKYITSDMLNYINDLASDTKTLLNQLSQNNFMFCNFLVLQFRPHFILQFIWNFIVLIFLIVNPFYIALKFSLNIYDDLEINQQQKYEFIFCNLPFFIFSLDIITDIIEKFVQNYNIKSNGNIFQSLVQIDLCYNIILLLPNIIGWYVDQRFEILLLLRLILINSQVQKIIQLFNLSEKVISIIEILEAILIILIASHICACFWFSLGQWEISKNQDSWINLTSINLITWESQYVYSLYFIFITALTIGYGDVYPVSTEERVVVMIFALIFCSILGYSVTKITNIVERLNEKEKLFRLKMMRINNYLKGKQINKQLHLEISKYFQNYFHMNLQLNEECEKLIQQLKTELKEKMLIDIYLKILKKSKMLTQLFEEQTLKKICLKCSEINCAPDTFITNNKQLNRPLYYLEKGEVELICNLSNSSVCLSKIGAGKFIGERDFIMQQNINYEIKTTSFCKLYIIEFDDFQEIIRENQIDLEKYSFLKDKMIFSGLQRNFGSLCPICKWTHHFMKCPFIFLNVNNDRVAYCYTKSEPQNRQQFNRISNKTSFLPQKLREEALEYMVNSTLINFEQITMQQLKQFGFDQIEDEHAQSIPSKSQNSVKFQSQLIQEDNLTQQQQQHENSIVPKSNIDPISLQQEKNSILSNSFIWHQQSSKFKKEKCEQSLIKQSKQNVSDKLMKSSSLVAAKREKNDKKISFKISDSQQSINDVEGDQQNQQQQELNVNINVDKYLITSHYHQDFNLDIILNSFEKQYNNQQLKMVRQSRSYRFLSQRFLNSAGSLTKAKI